MEYTPWAFEALQESGQIQAGFVRIVDSADFSRQYEMDCMSIMELDNGKFVTIYECGCSCYDARTDAEVEHHPDLVSAQEKLNRYKSENARGRWWS